MADEPGSVEEHQTPAKQPPKKDKWASMVAKAQAEMNRSNTTIENAAPSGVASDDTLRTRGYENLPKQKVAQPLKDR
jgi:hypothetical protein